ncbi:MAG: hypothetical protein WBO46_24895, partial [Caldilineaceae bacterium]
MVALGCNARLGREVLLPGIGCPHLHCTCEAFQTPTVEGASASRPELLKVNLIDYDYGYCGTNKKDFIDRLTNEIAHADTLK